MLNLCVGPYMDYVLCRKEIRVIFVWMLVWWWVVGVANRKCVSHCAVMCVCVTLFFLCRRSFDV